MPPPDARAASAQPLVLDTNIVLDAFVFDDADAGPLLAGIKDGRLCWLATDAMRDELARVLGYARIVPRLNKRGLAAADVLAAFDAHARRVETPVKASCTCPDPDDQKFIDLAVARRAWLLSKDKVVLSMQKRLIAQEIWTSDAIKRIAADFLE